MKTNTILENVQIERYAAQGKSIAKVDGKVIFITGGVPGDVVNVIIKRTKKQYDEGFVTQLVQPSKERVDPFCEHFGHCGGCQWQMLHYAQQVQFKQQQVEDALSRIGQLSNLPILPMVQASKTRCYRNKIEYSFSTKKYLTPAELNNPEINTNQSVVGFHAKGLFDKVVHIHQCHLQDPPTNAIRNYIFDYAVEHRLSFYDIRQHQGFLRGLQIRNTVTNEWMVNLIVGEPQYEQLFHLLQSLQLQFPFIHTLLYTLNTKLNDTLDLLTPVTYAGEGFITEHIEQLRFKISPKSFFQTNTEQATKLYQIVKHLAGIQPHDVVYDLYCGTGSIGIYLAQSALKIIGVEQNEAAYLDAQINAALNQLFNIHFFKGDVSKVCTDQFFETNGMPSIVIVDPPRAGLTEVLIKKMITMAPQKIVYVSCNPATQARDILLFASAYQLVATQAVDMFPHTHHIENVVLLTKNQS